MEIDRNIDSAEIVVHVEDRKAIPAGGLYSLPILGNVAAGARQLYDEMAPNDSDSTEVRIAKHVFRWGSAVTGAAAVAVVVL